eukprot:2190136-Amphidinium_carterae.1
MPHVPLHGITGGAFVAARVEAYPKPWCRVVVQCLAHAVLGKQAAKLQRYFVPCFGEAAQKTMVKSALTAESVVVPAR